MRVPTSDRRRRLEDPVRSPRGTRQGSDLRELEIRGKLSAIRERTAQPA
jgi:hypothetical protein